MPKINNLEYEDKFIQKKVNFYAVYYHFVVDNIGLYDELLTLLIYYQRLIAKA